MTKFGLWLATIAAACASTTGGDHSNAVASAGADRGVLLSGFSPNSSTTFTAVGQQFLEHASAAASPWQDGTGRHDAPHDSVMVGQDVVRLGPFGCVHRFLLRGSENDDQALHGMDGILGLGYSALSDSASILKSISSPTRPAWGIIQPASLRELQPRKFALLATETGGELQLGGVDKKALVGGEMFFVLANAESYTVPLREVWYGDKQILGVGAQNLGGGGPARGRSTARGGGMGEMTAEFDSGSSCVMLPDAAGGASGFAESPFRAVLAAHARMGAQTLRLELGPAGSAGVRVELPYAAWTHPAGCIAPFGGNKLVLGDPVFRRYVVLHDLSGSRPRLGIGRLDPDYASRLILPLSPPTVPADPATSIASTELPVKLRLQADDDLPGAGGAGGRARRYAVEARVGTPPQRVRLVLDTGSFATQLRRRSTEQPVAAPDRAVGRALAARKAARSRAAARLKAKAARLHGRAGAASGRSDRVRALGTRKDSLPGRRKAGPSTAPPNGWAQLGGVLALTALVGLAAVGELRRRRTGGGPRFRLVEYRASDNGGPSHFEFSDV